MARIGSFEVTVFRGLMPRARRRYRLKSHAGVDGDGVLFDAYHTGTVDITTRILLPEAQASDLLDAYRAAQEQHLLVIDQFGDQYPDTLVVDIVTQRELVIGGNAHAIGIWTLLPASTPPAGAI
jgi:hypothetical protein